MHPSRLPLRSHAPGRDVKYKSEKKSEVAGEQADWDAAAVWSGRQRCPQSDRVSSRSVETPLRLLLMPFAAVETPEPEARASDAAKLCHQAAAALSLRIDTQSTKPPHAC